MSLKFHVRDCDPDTGLVDDNSYPDEYTPENVDLYVGDFVLPTYIPSFESKWEELGNQVTETFALSELKSVKQTIDLLSEQLGLQPTESIIKEAARTSVTLGGSFVGGLAILARVNMIVNPTDGVTLQLNIRSPSLELSHVIADAIQ